MQLRYSFRLDPTPGQRIALARAFGCARVVYNDALRARRDAYAAGLGWISGGALHDRDLNAARNILTLGRQVAAGRAETLCARPGASAVDPVPAGASGDRAGVLAASRRGSDATDGR